MTDNVKNGFPFFKSNPDVVWLDNAAATQKPECMAEALNKFYNECNSNVYRGEYPFADVATRLYEDARGVVARWFGTSPERIAFTYNATDSLNISADIIGKTVKNGDNVIISALEHNSALLPWMRIREENRAEIRYIPVLPNGTIDIDAIPKLIDSRTRAAIITAGSNVNGYMPPHDKIREIFDGKNIPLIIDAAQSSAHVMHDASEMKFEYMCASAHKLYGPTGLGILIAGSEKAADALGRLGGGTVNYVTKDGFEKKPGVSGLEAGTPNAAGAYAFATVLDYLSKLDVVSLWQKEARLAETLKEELSSIGMKLVPCGGTALPVAAFDPTFMHPSDLARLLGSMGVCVRSGRHCAHIAHDELGFGATVRVSLGIYNSEDDIEKLTDAIKYLKGRFGNV